MKKKILICGATGFIGRNLAERFAQSGEYEVHAVRFTRPQYRLPGAVWHQADLRDAQACERLAAGMDVIVQAAATTSGSKDIVTKPFIHVTDNAVMNSVLFRAAFAAKVKHVVFFSCTVMYPSSDKALKETDFDANAALHPRYFGVGHTKLYIEKMCEFFAGISDTKFTAIRHSNIYGAYDKFDLERSHVFGASVTKVMTAADTITVWGTGEEERDLLHCDDLCDFVQAAVARQPEKFGLYNCGLGEAISIKNLVQKIIGASGKKLGVAYDLSAPTIKTSLFLDCAKAKTELGWQPKVRLDDGIARTVEWWKNNIDPATLKPYEKMAA
jgi:nucleoside-diphosphate-sugar epimerase